MPDRNWEYDLLEVKSIARGFVLGDGIVGVTPLGGGGAETDLRDVFTGISVNAKQALEADMFPHPDTVTLGMSTFQEDAPDYLDNANVRVAYDDLPVFTGRVTDWSIDKKTNNSLDGARRGRVEYSVTLTASNLAQRFARTTVDISGLPAATVGDRLIQAISFLTDVDIELEDQRLTDAWRTEMLAEGPADPTPKEAVAVIREAEMLLGAVAVYDPAFPARLRFRPVGAGMAWVDPPLTGETVTRGPYVSGMTAASEQNSGLSRTVATTDNPTRNDQSVTLDVDSADALQRFVNGLPLNARGDAAPVSVSTFLQPSMITDGTLIPNSVTLTDADSGDPVDYPVLGVTHTIGQKLWTIGLELGPSWMITKASISAPARPANVSYAAGVVSWTRASLRGVAGYRVCARTDRYPGSPDDSAEDADALLSDESAAITLTTGTWFVSLFVLTADDDIWAYPVTLDPIVVP